MRILKFFFLALMWIAIAGALLFFGGREILLLLAMNMLKSDYKTLANNNYAKFCKTQFDYDQSYSTQLRFSSDREYAMEVVCSDFATTPISIKKKSLPPLVKKTSVGSGVVLDEEKLPFMVQLSILGRHGYVYTDDALIHASYFSPPDLDYASGPASVCQAHQYQCCSLDVQSGEGMQLETVTDCPKSCYESCLLRPVFLFFKSQPAMEDATRVVELSAGETVTLSYVLGNGKSDAFANQLDKNASPTWLDKLQVFFSGEQVPASALALPVQVTLDFGDGQVWESQNLQDSVDHTYVCRLQTCYFQVQIKATDAQGATTLDNELSKMIIKVHR